MNADRQLVDRVLANAPGAFERLVGQYQGLCWHILLRLVREPEDARELCQETFLRVHQSLHQYRYESALKSWIGRVAYSVGLRHLERQRLPLAELSGPADESSLLENLADACDLEAAWADRETQVRLHAAIDALPPLQRTLLTLYHLDELPLAEIAEITGLAINTVKSHLFRTRLRLRERLEPTLETAV